jgi:hypothetical protein
MPKKLILSESYVRNLKVVYGIGVVVPIVAVIALLAFQCFADRPSPAPLRATFVVIAILCAFRINSLEEHHALFKAMTKSDEEAQKPE